MRVTELCVCISPNLAAGGRPSSPLLPWSSHWQRAAVRQRSTLLPERPCLTQDRPSRTSPPKTSRSFNPPIRRWMWRCCRCAMDRSQRSGMPSSATGRCWSGSTLLIDRRVDASRPMSSSLLERTATRFKLSVSEHRMTSRSLATSSTAEGSRRQKCCGTRHSPRGSRSA